VRGKKPGGASSSNSIKVFGLGCVNEGEEPVTCPWLLHPRKEQEERDLLGKRFPVRQKGKRKAKGQKKKKKKTWCAGITIGAVTDTGKKRERVKQFI